MAQKMVSALMHSAVLRKAPEGLTGYLEALYFMQADWKKIRLLEPGTTKSVDHPAFAALGINKEGVSFKQRRYWEMYTEDVTGPGSSSWTISSGLGAEPSRTQRGRLGSTMIPI